MKIGYCRVSTEDQNSPLQRDALKKAGCDKIFTDKASGASTTKRPQLAKCLKELGPDDVLIFWKLDRLGWSQRDLIAMLDDLKGRGVAWEHLIFAMSVNTHCK